MWLYYAMVKHCKWSSVYKYFFKIWLLCCFCMLTFCNKTVIRRWVISVCSRRSVYGSENKTLANKRPFWFHLLAKGLNVTYTPVQWRLFVRKDSENVCSDWQMETFLKHFLSHTTDKMLFVSFALSFILHLFSNYEFHIV